jgi:pimeloyl-ACP methyl ester carboxylesterase
MLTSFDDGRLFGSLTGADGPDERPWLLALHGWRRTHRDFDRVASVAGGPALALDLPGFGASPPPPEAWGGAEYAKAVAAVLPSMADRVVVLGHSFGGRVAVHLAALEPDRVAGLVLTGVPLLRPDGGSGGRRPALGYRIGRSLHRRGLLSETRMEALRQKYGSEDYRLAAGVMRSVHVRAVNETYEEPLRLVRCPVELVWGDDDTAAPLAVAQAAAELLGPDRARLTVLPGTGHLTPITAPDALAGAVARLRPVS